MGIAIDRQRATERLGRALVLAHSDEELAAEWLERARAVSRAKNKTFTPILGTALLAKVTDDDVDVHSLREDESDRGYSARSLAKEVLMPCCVRAGIDLRVRGPEPLNNQPFLRAPRVSTALKVTKRAVPELEHLCDCLTALQSLSGKAALEALAAFLRVRIADSESAPAIRIGSGVLSLSDLLEACDDAVRADESGGVLLAVVAASACLVFDQVRVRRSGDPTHVWHGDVGIFDRDVQTLAIDTSQRSRPDSDLLLFASRLAEAGIQRGVVVTAEVGGTEPMQLQFQAHRIHRIELAFLAKPSDAVRLAMLAGLDDLTLSLAAFPRLVLKHMITAGVDAQRMQSWADLFTTPVPEAER